MSRERFEGVTIGAVPCPKVIVTVLRASRSSQAGAGDESRPPETIGGNGADGFGRPEPKTPVARRD